MPILTSRGGRRATSGIHRLVLPLGRPRRSGRVAEQEPAADDRWSLPGRSLFMGGTVEEPHHVGEPDPRAPQAKPLFGAKVLAGLRLFG